MDVSKIGAVVDFFINAVIADSRFDQLGPWCKLLDCGSDASRYRGDRDLVRGLGGAPGAKKQHCQRHQFCHNLHLRSRFEMSRSVSTISTIYRSKRLATSILARVADLFFERRELTMVG